MFLMPLRIYTDSYSIFSYLRAAHLRFPAEKSSFLHLAFLKECLQHGVLESITWVDTRDMCVDGMTKGMADRTPLHRLMSGSWRLQHASESFAEPRTTSG